MRPIKSLHCTCSHCRGGIEFPVDRVGTSIACPHCGKSTELLLVTPEIEPALPRRLMVWTVLAVVVLGLGLAGSLVALKRAQNLAAKKRLTLPAASSTPSPAPAGGFLVVTNDFYISAIMVQRQPRGTMLQAVGVVSNGLARPRQAVRLELELLDAAGRRCGSSMDSSARIDARGLWEFRAPVLVTNASTARLASITEQTQ